MNNINIKRRDLIKLGLLGLAGVGVLNLSACGGKKFPKLSPNSAILALGDSLTAGYGGDGETYPKVLSQISKLKVINGGISGDTSAQALARLPELLSQNQDVKLVIISIGGNDFLRKIPESETRANITKIIQLIESKKINMILVGIPYFTVGALIGRVSEHPLYEDLAKQFKIPLLSGVWADILGDKELKSDQVHANSKGYRVFGEEMAKFIKKQGFI